MVPPVAVLTATHERRQSLRRVLESLRHQSLPADAFRVVVVCDGCTDGTADMVRSMSFPFDVTVIEQTPGRGPAAARNLGLAAVRSPIVVFIDDDVVPAANLLEVHASRHEERHDLIVIGPLLPPDRANQPWIRWEGDTLRKQYREMECGLWAPSPRQFYTGNASVRREHLSAVSGFDERLKRGEDVELAFRLQRRGLQFVFEPRAGATHFAHRSFHAWLGGAYEYGRAELAMGPVAGTRGFVDVKAEDFQRRSPIVRRLVLHGLAHPSIAPAVIMSGRIAGRTLTLAGLWRLARGAYTTIFELAYWRGVDRATGPSGSALAILDAGRERAGVRRTSGAHR